MSNFSWVDIYIEIAQKINEKTTDDLIELLKDCEDCHTNYLKNKKSGKDEWVKVDLFTFFGSFNRAGFESRKKILKHIITKLNLSNDKLPSDFDGIPVMENRNSFFYWADNEEKSDDLTNLNDLFKIASKSQDDIKDNFDKCLNIQGVGLSKLTTGLFWINPEKFMPIAGPVIFYLKRNFPNFEHDNEKGAKAWDKIFKGMKWEKYNTVLKYLNDESNHSNGKKSFKELSLESIESSVENEILENKNVIFHGAPGTGKTYSVLKAVESLTAGDTSRYTLVQFHPSYGYEDFIDGIKPVKSSNGGNINLELENGTFKSICKKAFENLQSKEEETKPYFFIADEINRAELSRVFGELLLCLEDDKRLRFENGKLVGTKIKTQNSNLWEDKHAVVIENAERFFGIPENLYFIGTMNDIDRSVDSFDMALRRRFTWIRTEFNERAIREKKEYTNHKKLEDYIKTCYKLNEFITSDKDGGYGFGFDYQLGQSYFLKPKDLTEDELGLTWDKYIAPLLTEYLRSVVEQHEIPKRLEEAQKRFKL